MKRLSLTILLLSLALNIMAALRLPSFFSNHMVIQRQKPVRLWGWADKGAQINISISGTKVTAKADKEGRWHATLPMMEAGGPFTLDVWTKRDTIRLQDVMIGEVWICSGQSNMEFHMREVKNSEEEIASATNNLIRSFDVKKAMSRFPLADVEGGEWTVCSPKTVGEFTAVGYLFIREIAENLQMPVGIINASWGGTDIESWMSMETIDRFPKYKRLMSRLRSEDLEQYLARGKEVEAAFREAVRNEPGEPAQWYLPSFPKDDWRSLHVPGLWTIDELSGVDGVVWTTTQFMVPDSLAGRQALLSLGIIDDDDVTWINGQKVGSTVGYDVKRRYIVPEGVLKGGLNELTVKIIDNHGGGGCYGSSDLYFLQIGQQTFSILDSEWDYKIAVDNEAFEYVEDGPNAFPSRLYNAMVAPLTGYSARGFLWYQGENNAPKAQEYYRLFPAMINDWRQQWNDSDMPFYWVQLANYMLPDDHPSMSNWATLRNAQNKTRMLPHTGQAVIIDVGEANDIHPKDKQTVAHRLALLALHYDYGKNVWCESPQPLTAMRDGHDVLVTFDHVADGLKAKCRYGYLCGFSIAGTDGKFQWVKARVESKNVVRLKADNISNPRIVRYAWADNPDDANLYNSEGLPSTPFEIDINP